MTTSRDAYVPGKLAQMTVLEHVLRSYIESLMSQGFQGIRAEVSVWVQGKSNEPESIVVPSTAKELVPAEVRCEYRHTINPDRSLFMIQAMLDEPLLGSGFSGFKIKGDLREIAGVFTAKLVSAVGHYNVRSWSKW